MHKLESVDEKEWVEEREWRAYAKGRHVYMFHHSYREAKRVADTYGGTAWTEHSADEGDGLLYQRGPGFVNVMGFVAVLPKPMTADHIQETGAQPIYLTQKEAKAAIKRPKGAV